MVGQVLVDLIRESMPLLEKLLAKWRLIRWGSEKPLPPFKPLHPDSVLEEYYKEFPNVIPYEKRFFAKHLYMERKTHERRIEHNKRIRKLDKKIKSGLYDNNDFANKW